MKIQDKSTIATKLKSWLEKVLMVQIKRKTRIGHMTYVLSEEKDR